MADTGFSFFPSCDDAATTVEANNNCPAGITNESYIKAAESQAKMTYIMGAIEAAIQLLLAEHQRRQSSKIAGMQDAIADRQMKLAEALHDHAKKFWPEEKRLVEEAFNEQRAATLYTLGDGFAAIQSKALSTGRQDWIKETRRMCLDPDVCEDARWQRTAQMLRADTLSFGARQAEGRAQTLRDRRFDRQYNVLRAPRGQLEAVVGFQKIAASMSMNVANAMRGTINSMARELGYWTTYRSPGEWTHNPAISQNMAQLQVQGGSRPTHLEERREAPVIAPVINLPAPEPAKTGDVEITLGNGGYNPDTDPAYRDKEGHNAWMLK